MFDEDPTPPGPRLGVYASVAIEIDWVLSGAYHPGRTNNAVLDDLYPDRPDLVEAVRSMWGPDEELSYPGYLEMSVLAHHGGLLFSTDAAALLDGLEVLAATAPADLVLGSENPDDRDRLLRRLRVLRESPQRRSRYVQVVKDVWAAVAPVWESEGRPAVEAAVATRRRQLERSRPSWRDVTGDAHLCTNIEALVDELGSEGELAVVPAYFTRKGLTVDLPGLVVVGVRTDDSPAAIRARAEGLARRLKAISDPTRLALLESLAGEAMTVTDLAARFCLAQPTVSNHVKILRDAGVVGGSEADRRRLVVQPSALDDIINELQTLTRTGRRPDGLG
jgi:ArsR family transcriptional regulator